jgi:hypothetical protein
MRDVNKLNISPESGLIGIVIKSLSLARFVF